MRFSVWLLRCLLGLVVLVSAGGFSGRGQAQIIPTLHVRWQTPEQAARPGTVRQFYFTVTNTGTEPIPNIEITLRLPPEMTLRYDSAYPAQPTITSLPAGESYLLHWALNVPETAGIYDVYVEAVTGSVFAESWLTLAVTNRLPSLVYINAGQFHFVDGLRDNAFLDVPYGALDAVPLIGDWDGDGVSGIAVYDNDAFFLRQTTEPPRNPAAGIVADKVITLGDDTASAQPIAGDWTGDGIDGIGIYAGGTFFLRDFPESGSADTSFAFTPVDNGIAIAGDWDGDGIDTIGLYADGTFYLRNTNSAGDADVSFAYGGQSTAQPVVGDWDGDGTDGIGIIVGDTLFIRNALSSGEADETIVLSTAYGQAIIRTGYWLAISPS